MEEECSPVGAVIDSLLHKQVSVYENRKLAIS